MAAIFAITNSRVPSTSLLSIISIQGFYLPSSKTKNKKDEKQGGNTTPTLRTAHFLVFQHIFPRDLPYWKADDTCITPFYYIYKANFM